MSGKNQGESEKWGEKEYQGRKGKNQEGSFTLPLLTDELATLLSSAEFGSQTQQEEVI